MKLASEMHLHKRMQAEGRHQGVVSRWGWGMEKEKKIEGGG